MNSFNYDDKGACLLCPGEASKRREKKSNLSGLTNDNKIDKRDRGIGFTDQGCGFGHLFSKQKGISRKD